MIYKGLDREVTISICHVAFLSITLIVSHKYSVNLSEKTSNLKNMNWLNFRWIAVIRVTETILKQFLNSQEAYLNTSLIITISKFVYSGLHC